MASIWAYGPLGAGHINPTLGIVAELVRRGHRVTYRAPRAFADRIAETGARFEPVVSTWEQLESGPAQLQGKGLIQGMGLLLDETKALVPGLAESEPGDLVLHDGPLAWWGRILAHRWGVPAVETWPSFVSNRHWSMKSYAKVNPLSPRLLWQLVRLAGYLRSQGISDVGGFMQGRSAAARIVTLPRAFQYAGDTFDDYHFVGPCLTPRAFQAGWTPPVPARPVQLIALGSTAYNAQPDFYKTIIGSAAGRRWHVVVAIGDRVDPAELGPIPENVEVHRQVPQLQVLAHAQVFVTHAGMGSTMEGIYHRVPLVAVPQMAEQRANADRVAELGLGVTLDPGSLNAETIWSAVTSVADDEGVRWRLAEMRRQMDVAGGATVAADVVEKVLAGG